MCDRQLLGISFYGLEAIAMAEDQHIEVTGVDVIETAVAHGFAVRQIACRRPGASLPEATPLRLVVPILSREWLMKHRPWPSVTTLGPAYAGHVTVCPAMQADSLTEGLNSDGGCSARRMAQCRTRHGQLWLSYNYKVVYEGKRRWRILDGLRNHQFLLKGANTP